MRALPPALLALLLFSSRGAAAATSQEADGYFDPRAASDKAVSLDAGGLHSDADSGAGESLHSAARRSTATASGTPADGGLRDAKLEKGATLSDHFDPKAVAKRAAVADAEDPQAGGNPHDEENCRTGRGYCKKLIDEIIQKTKLVGVYENLAAMPFHQRDHGLIYLKEPGEGFSVGWTAGVPGAQSHGGECDAVFDKCESPLIVTWVSRTPGGKALCATPRPVIGEGSILNWTDQKNPGWEVGGVTRAGWEYCVLKPLERYYFNVSLVSYVKVGPDANCQIGVVSNLGGR